MRTAEMIVFNRPVRLVRVVIIISLILLNRSEVHPLDIPIEEWFTPESINNDGLIENPIADSHYAEDDSITDQLIYLYDRNRRLADPTTSSRWLKLDKLATLLDTIGSIHGNKITIESEEQTLKDHSNEATSSPINDPADFRETFERVGKLRPKSEYYASTPLLLDDTSLNYLDKMMGLDSTLDREAVVISNRKPVGEGGANSKNEMQPTGEHIDYPLALTGHQFVQGGAGEGKQLLGPDGTFENVQVVKSDNAILAYCDPPNPCPIGYTAEDGCLEQFVNSASFSREYQAKQQCSCDNEHSLFNCATPVSTTKDHMYKGTHKGNEIDDDDDDENNSIGSHSNYDSSGTAIPGDKIRTLARTIKNRFGGLDSVISLMKQRGDEMLAMI